MLTSECPDCGKVRAIYRGIVRRCRSCANKKKALTTTRIPVSERFLAKVRKTSSCWIWTASRLLAGYGKMSIRGCRESLAHRISYMLFVGKIPSGLQVLHRCDRPECVNPGHLFLGTQADNLSDCIAKGRSHHAKGERIRNAILNSEAIRIIRSTPRRYGSQVALANQFKCSVRAINAVLTGRTWSYIK